MTHTTPDDRYAELLMKAVDDVLTPDEAREWDALVAERPGAARELTELRDIKSVTDGVAARIRADADLEPPKETRATKVVLVTAFVLLLVGALALASYAGYGFFTDPTVPTGIKGAVAALIAGGAILLGYVLRVRLRGLRRDPYRHIDL